MSEKVKELLRTRRNHLEDIVKIEEWIRLISKRFSLRVDLDNDIVESLI